MFSSLHHRGTGIPPIRRVARPSPKPRPPPCISRAWVEGWLAASHPGDNHPVGAPVVVVTHRPPPNDAVERFPRTTFTGSVEEGIAAAKEIAGDKFVTIASADIIQQALNLSLVDELCISQVPVLFGTGIRYFGELVGDHVMLEDPVVIQGTRALHLRYPVRR